MLPGTLSAQESGFLWDLIKGILPFMSHAFLRKLGHFAEYAVLGGMLSATLNREAALLRPRFLQGLSEELRRLWLPGLVSLLAAAVDEGIIQRLTPGRSGQLSDVLIDLGGALFGAALACLCGLRRP